MNKHFEHVWESAEKVAKEYLPEEAKSLHMTTEGLVASLLDKLLYTKANKKENFGNLLFALCYLSDRDNVNTWTALEQATLNCKIKMLEDD